MLRYVNTASTAGGDGTTNATSGANRAYASLSAWEAAEQADLTTLAEISEVRCCGTAADTTPLYVDGWTTSASYYIHIRGNPDDANGRHAGVFSASHYRLAVDTSVAVVEITENYTRLEGFQVHNMHTATGDHNPAGITAVGTHILFDSMISRGTPNGGDFIAAGFTIGPNGEARNCIAFDWRKDSTSRGYGFRRAGLTATARNCTAYNCFAGYYTRDDGASAAQQLVVVNCLAAACSDGFQAQWVFGTGSDYNASSVASDAPGSNSRNSQTFSFVDTGAFDFRLTSSDAGARDFGLDLSGNFTTDIAGQTRTAPWDIGAWEYQAAGGAVYDESVTLAVDAGVLLARTVTMDAAVALATEAGISESRTLTMDALLALAAEASTSETAAATIARALGLDAQAAAGFVAGRALDVQVDLGGVLAALLATPSRGLTDTVALDAVAGMTTARAVALTAVVSLAAEGSLSASAQAAIDRAVSLAATAGLTPAQTAVVQAQASLLAQAAIAVTGGRDVAADVSLGAQAALAAIASRGLLDAVGLGASAGLSTSAALTRDALLALAAQVALAAEGETTVTASVLALAVRADLTVARLSVMESSLLLGASADLATQAGAVYAEQLALAVLSTLETLDTLGLPPAVIRVIRASLATSGATDVRLLAPGAINVSLE